MENMEGRDQKTQRLQGIYEVIQGRELQSSAVIMQYGNGRPRNRKGSVI
jgi:hypothetical protein